MRTRIKWGDFVIIGVVVLLAAAIVLVMARGAAGDTLYAEVWQDVALL